MVIDNLLRPDHLFDLAEAGATEHSVALERESITWTLQHSPLDEEPPFTLFAFFTLSFHVIGTDYVVYLVFRAASLAWSSQGCR